jgi:hypothetical protein
MERAFASPHPFGAFLRVLCASAVKEDSFKELTF